MSTSSESTLPEATNHPEPLRSDSYQKASLLEAFVSCTADAIIGFASDGTITYWNKAAERMFGYTVDEALGKTYTLIGTPQVYDFQHRVFSETIRGDTHQWYDTQRMRKDGTVLDVSITTSPLIIGGEIVGLVGIVRDITEKVRTANQLAQLNAKLQANAEEKRRFVNMVLHDLRHPLATIKTLLYLLNHDSNAPADEYWSAIEGRVIALNRLLDELTIYQRIEAGRAALVVEPVDLLQLVQDCTANFSPVLTGTAVQILADVPITFPNIVTDYSKLNHILLNLLSNAIKFTAQGVITVRARQESDTHWSLTVVDTGAGIPARIKEHIFDEFVQGDSVAPRREGSGLGLSIVKQLSDLLRGEIEVSSNAGEGTSFCILFPLDITLPSY